MTRILLVETASPKRVRKKAEEILSGGPYPMPEVTILCRPEATTVQYFAEIPGIKIVPFEKIARKDILLRLRQSVFDVVWMFWTCEAGYLDMKRVALRLRGLFSHVDIGDGHSFKLSRGNIVSYLRIRLKHRRPSDADLFQFNPASQTLKEVPPEDFGGEKVLIIQSAPPAYILRALDRLSQRPLFNKPRYTLFCRNRIEVVRPLAAHPILHRIVTHSEMQGAWRHLRTFRRERFDVVVVFFTGDASYWKIKYFAFLLGARHKVIFNESNDCFYLNARSWLALTKYRHEQQLQALRSSTGASMTPLSFQTRIAAVALTKLLLLPFRFLWLLLNWARLRLSALRETS